MTKFLRCEAPGCRTLTGNGLCDRHREPEPAVEASPWDKISAEEWEAARVKAERMFGEIVAQRDTAAARRADLAELENAAQKQARRAEHPTFSGEC